jgi:hypothetical protein
MREFQRALFGFAFFAGDKTENCSGSFWSTVSSVGEQSGLLTRTRGDGKRFVVRADEKLTVFLELELAVATT